MSQQFDTPSNTIPRRNLTQSPPVAWPTLLLTGTILFAWAWISWKVFFNGLSPWVALVFNTILAYMSFTPQHEAVHGSVSKKHTALNGIVGRLAGVPLLSPFHAFKRLHLTHHKHTNDPDNDPDFWSGKGPWYILPLRWLTQDFYYWYISITSVKEASKTRKAEVIGTLVIFYGTALWMATNGHLEAVIWAWIVPSRIASALLAFMFDYLPHRPHRIAAKTDPFKATRNIIAPGVTVLFLAQNYHLVHHVFPTAPFYHYVRIWRRHHRWFTERGGQSDSFRNLFKAQQP
ncbi:MAG: fatty acid desaturase [Flavobacteriales bacterium]|nr:fatty acid desaturase [Flavobacteriales bacterium]